MNLKTINTILKRCLGHRDGESVIVVTDTLMESAARAFANGATDLGVETAIVSMSPRRAHGEEPPAPVAAAIASCPVAVILTTASLTHTAARREACEKHGVRIASMPGVFPDRADLLLDIDFDELRARCDELARLLEGGRKVRLTSPAGTDLTFEISGCPVFRDNGDLSARGAFGNLPPGEVFLAPLEATASGIVMVDGSIGGLGLADTPVPVRFVDGRAVEIGAPRLRKFLEPYGPDALQLAELGIGTNPRAAIRGNFLEDEKAIGTAHLALGSNLAMGGRVRVPVHVNLVLRGSRIEVDDKPIPERFLTPAAPPPDAPPAEPVSLDLASPEAYRTLFLKSNDPQIVLELDSQKILEANTPFEQLTGFDRPELLSSGTTFSTFVAPESYQTYLHKRQLRRDRPSERYDIRLLTKAGEKIPVELSVQVLPLPGPTAVLVSIRDVTRRKAMEQEMWKRIEELGRQNNRIFALTEKIRSVPELTPKLLHIADEEELLERTAQLLCSREGLGYAGVSFHLLREDALELVHSTVKTKKRKLKLSGNQRLVRVVRGEDEGGMTNREAILPLKGRERNLGVIEVFFHPKEIEVLQGNERALEGYRDLLVTLSNMIGLLVENLHLYEKVRRQAVIDPLTNAYNRRYLDSKLAEETHRADRYGRDLSLLMIDIDRFAEFNNKYFHDTGDAVLAEVARLLRAHTREVDTVCRYGGDEFSILMPETDHEAALTKARTLGEAVREREFPNLREPAAHLRLSLSIGVATFEKGMQSGEALLRAADQAMYEAKDAGRDTVKGKANPKFEARNPK